MNRVILFSKMYLLLDRRARLPASAINPCPGAKKMDLVSGSHSIGQNLYHLEWCLVFDRSNPWWYHHTFPYHCYCMEEKIREA